MPQQWFESRSIPATTSAFDDGPALDCGPHADPADQLLRIRARRVYPVSREELFAAWTRRTSWDCWMRLRARSRCTLSPYPGGSFRLELAEGPAIHVISGTILEVRPPELLSFSWIHLNTNDHGSTVDASFIDRLEHSELTIVHRSISNRREAAWLMRLWTSFLNRLGTYVGGVRRDARPLSRGLASAVDHRRPSSAA